MIDCSNGGEGKFKQWSCRSEDVVYALAPSPTPIKKIKLFKLAWRGQWCLRTQLSGARRISQMKSHGALMAWHYCFFSIWLSGLSYQIQISSQWGRCTINWARVSFRGKKPFVFVNCKNDAVKSRNLIGKYSRSFVDQFHPYGNVLQNDRVPCIALRTGE